jgi:hypothetical protein
VRNNFKKNIFNKYKQFTVSKYWKFVNPETDIGIFFFIKKKIQYFISKSLKLKIQNISNQDKNVAFKSYVTDKKILDYQSKLICHKLNFFFSKLNLHFDNSDYLKILNNYRKIFKKSKIQNLEGGIGYNNGLFIFSFNKLLKTKFFVESGTYKGFSSYLIDRSSNPNQKIYSFDINLKQLEWKSKKIKYFENDITFFNQNIDWQDCIIFFDDHYSHYDRLLFSYKKKVKYLIFDDDVGYLNLHSDGTPPIPTINMMKSYKFMPKKFRWIFNNNLCKANMSSIKFGNSLINLYHSNTVPDIFELTGYRNSSSTSFLLLKN